MASASVMEAFLDLPPQTTPPDVRRCVALGERPKAPWKPCAAVVPWSGIALPPVGTSACGGAMPQASAGHSWLLLHAENHCRALARTASSSANAHLPTLLSPRKASTALLAERATTAFATPLVKERRASRQSSSPTSPTLLPVPASTSARTSVLRRGLTDVPDPPGTRNRPPLAV